MDQNTAQRRILIVDDEENYRQIISMTLSMMGYEVLEATNGLDGLAAAKMHHPDLILCDVNMPKMDGHELLNQLKQEKEFTGIPFIFLTGNSAQADMRKGMQLGADDYLTKPFTAEELINAVETRIAKKQTIQKYFESQFDDIKSNIALSLPHEYRTPLNGILGFSQILMEEELPAGEVKQIGEMIHRSGKRLHRLLENMVLYGQLQLWLHDEAKVRDLRSCESGLVKDTVAGAVQRATERHHRPGAVTTELALVSVRMSAQYLAVIIEELLDNALKFSDAGTTVTLRCERKGTETVWTVSDNGRGMSEEQVRNISGFQQFERGYYEQQGAGLGLAVTRMLTEVHNGTLSMESTKGKGTTVTLRLPLASE